MRRFSLCLTGLVLALCHLLAARTQAQPVRMPTPVTPTYQPPPSVAPYATTTPPPNYPPALPPAAQPQAMQNLVGDTQRYGLPFDPYAQPAQYVPPPPPVAAVPYAVPPPTAAPPLAWPAMPTSWGGFYAGFDGTVLEARTGALSITGVNVDFAPVAFAPDVTLGFEPDFDFELSPRVWVGYKGAAGFGVRGRWWWYDHSGAGSFDMPPLPEGDPVDLDGDLAVDDALNLSLHSDLRFNVIDLEGTQDGEFHNWDFQVSGGVRWASIDYDLSSHIVGTLDVLPAPVDFDGKVNASAEFSGVGPTISFAARRPIVYMDGLAFLMNVRMSFLFGDTESRFTTSGTNIAISELPPDVNFEDSIQAWEAQVGFEYSRQLASGARLFGGAYLEGQIWEWGFPAGLASNDIGFFGPTFTVGIAR